MNFVSNKNLFDPFGPINAKKILNKEKENINTYQNSAWDNLYDIEQGSNRKMMSNALLKNKDIKFLTPHIKEGLVILITDEALGQGNIEFGKKLLIDMILGFSNNIELPQSIIFINSGVKLSESKDVVSILKQIANYGTEILVSKESLDFYNVKKQIGMSAGMGDVSQRLITSTNTIRL